MMDEDGRVVCPLVLALPGEDVERCGLHEGGTNAPAASAREGYFVCKSICVYVCVCMYVCMMSSSYIMVIYSSLLSARVNSAAPRHSLVVENMDE